MKKNKSINYIVTLLILIGIFVLIFSRILANPVSNLDELWNYNTARQIMNGLVPYKDISMITTPLLPTIVAIILKLTVDELIVFRIITAIVSTAIIYMTYLILKTLLKNKVLSFILTSIILYVYNCQFMLDYNFVILLITLIIEYMELKRLERIKIQKNEKTIDETHIEKIRKTTNGADIEKTINENDTEKLEKITDEIYKQEVKKTKWKNNIIIEIEKNIKFNLIIGILAGLAICTKQTAGVFVAFGTIIVELLFVNNKENFKQYLKNALVRITGMLIPCIIFLGFLIISGALGDFINYALLGIKTFSNSIPYLGLIKSNDIIVKLLAIILPIFLFIILDIIIINSIPKQRRISIKKLSILEIMTTYSTVTLIILYPISDKVHFLVATLPLLIELMYVLIEVCKNIKLKICKKILEGKDLVIVKHVVKSKRTTYTKYAESDRKETYTKYITLTTKLICIAIIVSIGVKFTYKKLNIYLMDENKNKNIEHYKNIIVSDYISNIITKVNKLIDDAKKEKIDVVILDAEASVVDIPLNRYHKNYDMFLKGNIGKDGEQGIINDIQSSHKCIYLIKKDKKMLNWQTPTKVIDYVKENLEKIGELDLYNIYYKS